jgi:hypothetical protein
MHINLSLSNCTLLDSKVMWLTSITTTCTMCWKSNTNDNASVATITQQTSANATMGSTLGGTYAALLAPTNPSPSMQDYALRQWPSTNCQPTKLQYGLTCRICRCAMLLHPCMWQIRLLFDQTHSYSNYGYSHQVCGGRRFLLKNPPSLAPRPDFTRLCMLRYAIT